MDGRAMNGKCIAAVLFGLASPALADGPTLVAERMAVPPALGAAVDWTGPYAGLALGGGWSDGEADLEGADGELIERDVRLGLFPSSIDDQAMAAFGSVSAGYNLQWGRVVGGVEIDLGAVGEENEIDFSRVDPGSGPPKFAAFAGVDTMSSYSTDIDALASLRLRAGIAQGSSLFFATGGLAAGRVENQFALDVPEFPGGALSESWSESGTRYGYAIGIGMERRLTDRMSIKGEIMYFDLEDVTIEARTLGQALDYEFDNDAYVARIGLNFRF